LGQGGNPHTSRPPVNSLQTRIDLRTGNTKKARLKELDKTIYLSIVDNSIFIVL
jgi:hypothetical protein